jgi:ADP-heptose:LPS heptosyltransferase
MTDISHLNPRRILACQLRQIGDVVISTAMVELLARRWPEAEIHFLTEAKCSPILENNPHISKVWALEKRGPLADAGFLFRAARQGYDLFVDFQQLPRTRLAALMTDAPVRLAGEAKWYKTIRYTHLAAMHKGGYAGRFKAQVLAPLGIEWDMQPPRMYLSDAERQWADAHLAARGLCDGDTLVTLDATHWSDTRRWPARHWAACIRLLLERRPDLRFYLFHGPGERGQVEEVVRLSGRGERCMLPGENEPPSLRRTAAVMARASAQAGNCSAPRHMAVALGVPTVTVIGSNGDTAWTFPDQSRHRIAFHHLPCSKCNRNTCALGTLECLNGLAPEVVAGTLLELLETTTEAEPS